MKVSALLLDDSSTCVDAPESRSRSRACSGGKLWESDGRPEGGTCGAGAVPRLLTADRRAVSRDGDGGEPNTDVPLTCREAGTPDVPSPTPNKPCCSASASSSWRYNTSTVDTPAPWSACRSSRTDTCDPDAGVYAELRFRPRAGSGQSRGDARGDGEGVADALLPTTLKPLGEECTGDGTAPGSSSGTAPADTSA